MPRVFFLLILISIFFSSASSSLANNVEIISASTAPSGQVLGLSAYAQELTSNTVPKVELPKDLNLGKPKFLTPDNQFYFLKTSLENAQLFLSFDQTKKQELRLQLAAERLSEIKYLLDNGNSKDLSNVTRRYRQISDDLSKDLKALKSRGVNISDLAKKVEKQASVHQIFAESLPKSTQEVLSSLKNTLTASSQSVLDLSADVRSEAAVPEELLASINDLSKDGILTSEQRDKILNLKSREDVRKELLRLNEQGLFPLAELKKLDKGVKENFPEYYSKSVENLKYAELRSYAGLTDSGENPDSATPTDIKTRLLLKRITDLAKEIDFHSLNPEQAKELTNTFSKFVKTNPSLDASTIQKCPDGWSYSPENGGWCKANSGNSSKPPTALLPICTDKYLWDGKSCIPQFKPPQTPDKSLCPASWHFVEDSRVKTNAGVNGWCKADDGNKATAPTWKLPICAYDSFWYDNECVLYNKPSPTTTSSSSAETTTSTASADKCPKGWNLVGGATAWCQADQGNTAAPPSGWPIPVCASGTQYNGTSCIGGTVESWCPSGWTYKLLAGGSNGWCSADSGNNNPIPANWKVPICALNFYWDGKTCVATGVSTDSSVQQETCPTYQETGTIFVYRPGIGCVYNPGTWGYCGPDYYWMGDACKKSTDGRADCGAGFDRASVTTPCFEMYPPNCPSGWTWQAGNGGWCKADTGNSSAIPTKWQSGHVTICTGTTVWNGTSCAAP